jgi:glycylpeptide N-tetradecanoyltransferase
MQSSDGKITDFCSFYHLPSTIIGNPLHNKLNAVYSFYNVANTLPLVDLMRDMLTMAKLEGADVFNALDLMGNGVVMEELKFGAGDGCLQFYLYNWKCAEMPPSDVGIVLL